MYNNLIRIKFKFGFQTLKILLTRFIQPNQLLVEAIFNWMK
jgi:hypothetical protein